MIDFRNNLSKKLGHTKLKMKKQSNRQMVRSKRWRWKKRNGKDQGCNFIRNKIMSKHGYALKT